MNLKLINIIIVSLVLSSCSSMKENNLTQLSDINYNNAFQKLKSMGENPESFSFKEAVLLNENAFHDDTLDIGFYNNKVDSIGRILNQFIIANN